MVTPRVYDLVRVDPRAVRFGDGAPSWARDAIERIPWAVVRRAHVPGWIALGIRGSGRAERCQASVRLAGVREVRTPESLAGITSGRALPAFDALAQVRAAARGLVLSWGPVGAVGFELATGANVVHAGSDLDIVVRPAPRVRLEAFATALRDVPVRCDVVVERDDGGIALAELLNARGRVLLRTAHGPVFIS